MLPNIIRGCFYLNLGGALELFKVTFLVTVAQIYYGWTIIKINDQLESNPKPNKKVNLIWFGHSILAKSQLSSYF